MRRGEVGDKFVEGTGGGGISVRRDLRDEIEDPRDLVFDSTFHDSNEPVTGDGNGVMSSMAVICGDEMLVPGDTEPAEE